jgi:hypothetical protein
MQTRTLVAVSTSADFEVERTVYSAIDVELINDASRFDTIYQILSRLLSIQYVENRLVKCINIYLCISKTLSHSEYFDIQKLYLPIFFSAEYRCKILCTGDCRWRIRRPAIIVIIIGADHLWSFSVVDHYHSNKSAKRSSSIHKCDMQRCVCCCCRTAEDACATAFIDFYSSILSLFASRDY